jgi:putative endonuclease
MSDVDWFVYIIEASDQSLYTGITTDPERRFKEHSSGPLGAKYFKGRQPVQILYRESCQNRSVASVREAEIKKLSRAQKLQLIGAHGTVSG